jgi:hypothetical protein
MNVFRIGIAHPYEFKKILVLFAAFVENSTTRLSAPPNRCACDNIEKGKGRQSI